jgi:hypothetical protein
MQIEVKYICSYGSFTHNFQTRPDPVAGLIQDLDLKF